MVVTFEMQNNDQKYETIIYGRTDYATLCPVLKWAHLVNQIWTYPSTMEDTPVCAAWRHNRLEQIPSHQVLAALWAACTTIGSTRLSIEDTKLAPILFVHGQQWRCNLQASLSLPSCSLADGQVTLSFITSENKTNNSPNTSQSRCSHFNLSEQS
jgi:hypothetical protein